MKSLRRQQELAAEFAEKAFGLRDRASEREKLYISWRYYSSSTRELDKAIETLELWKQTYPRDTEPPNTLAFYYTRLGQIEKAIEEAREAIRLNPDRSQPYSNLMLALICLNRYDEAKAVYEQAKAQNIDSTGNHYGLYMVAFAQNDLAEMERQIAWMAGRPNEYESFDWQAKSASFGGQMQRARELSTRAIEIAERSNFREVAAQYAARAALREAIIGECDHARKDLLKEAVASRTSSSAIDGAIALAWCGDLAQAQAIADDQARRFPKDTLLNSIMIPTVRAVMELKRNNPAQAVRALQPAARYEMGYSAGFWPMFIRGHAYLQARAGAEAAAEFEKILNNRGLNVNSSLYSLAQLGYARVAALRKDAAASRRAYESFFALWKDADPDLRLLREARKEYAGL